MGGEKFENHSLNNKAASNERAVPCRARVIGGLCRLASSGAPRVVHHPCRAAGPSPGLRAVVHGEGLDKLHTGSGSFIRES